MADENARDEGAQHCVHTDRVGGQRHQSGHYQYRGDDGNLADKPVIRPADHPKHEAAPNGEAEDEKDRGANEALREPGEINAAMQRQPEDHRHDDPTDRVVDDRGCDDHLTDGTAKEADLAHNHGNDLDRRDRQSSAEKQGRDQPLLRIGQDRVGQQLTQQHAAQEGYNYPGDRHAECSPARAADHHQISLHPGQ